MNITQLKQLHTGTFFDRSHNKTSKVIKITDKYILVKALTNLSEYARNQAPIYNYSIYGIYPNHNYDIRHITSLRNLDLALAQIRQDTDQSVLSHLYYSNTPR